MHYFVYIDPNVRTTGNQTYSGFEFASGDPSGWEIGLEVEAIEPESGIKATAVVTGIDRQKQIVYLAVPWTEMA